MPKFVEATEALNTLRQLLYETAMNQFDFDTTLVFEDIAKNRLETWIDLIPPAEAGKLVFCENCEYLSEDRIAPNWQRICRKYGVEKSDCGFCDEAMRKGDKNE